MKDRGKKDVERKMERDKRGDKEERGRQRKKWMRRETEELYLACFIHVISRLYALATVNVGSEFTCQPENKTREI